MPLRIEDIPKMSDTELETYLESVEFDTMGRKLAMEEHIRRKLSSISKPHWTLTPTFIVALAALLVAGLAAYFSYLSIPQQRQVSGSSQQSQIESKTKNPDAQSVPITKK